MEDRIEELEDRILQLERRTHSLEIDLQHANFNGELPSQSLMIDKIAAVLPLAQSEYGQVIPNKQGHNGQYANLLPYYDATFEALNKHGLFFYHHTSYWKGELVLRARILHKASGQWIETHIKIPNKPDAMKYASEETKFKRYTARNILGIIGTEDEEGGKDENITPKKNTTAHTPKKPYKTPEKISQQEADVIQRTIGSPSDIENIIFETLRISSISDIKQSDLRSVTSLISRELAKNE